MTTDLVDEAGHPTRGAADRVIAFLAGRLRWRFASVHPPEAKGSPAAIPVVARRLAN